MNLIEYSWLPCRRMDGTIAAIAPADVTDPTLRSIATARADFTGAAFQWMVGVVQLALKPRDIDDWLYYREDPPDRATLVAKLEPLREAFEVVADGPAFFQDLNLPADAPCRPIDDLLIDRASDSNLHFNHPFERPGFCLACTALALLTLQSNAPPGGRGIRTSVRGGGPLTTMLLPERLDATLWEALWLNVLPLDVVGVTDAFDVAEVLPWLRPTRTSDGPTGQETLPGDVHPLQVGWSFSRRIRLDPDDCSPGCCDLCGADSLRLFHTIRTRHGGTNYAGPWVHPHTPYRHDSKGVAPPLSVKGAWGRHAYRRWASLALRRPEVNGAGPSAATIVHHHARRALRVPVRLWCSGYEMDNAKARNWYDSVLPMHDVPDYCLPQLRSHIATALDGAEDALSALNKAVRDARFAGAGKSKGHWAPIAEAFWSATESPFYRLLNSLVDCVRTLEDDAASATATAVGIAFNQWLLDLRVQTLQLFDTYALGVPLEAHNAKHLVIARRGLDNALYASRAMKHMRSLVRIGQEGITA